MFTTLTLSPQHSTAQHNSSNNSSNNNNNNISSNSNSNIMSQRDGKRVRLTEEEKKEEASKPWVFNPYKKLKICMTCGQEGHDYIGCMNPCDKCKEIHTGGACPVFPELYDVADKSIKSDAVVRLKKEADEAERLVHQREARLKELRMVEGLVYGRKTAALDAKPNRCQSGQALQLLGATAWGEVDPEWKSRGGTLQNTLKLQWNAEAAGLCPYAEGSAMRAAVLAKFGKLKTLKDD